LRLSIIITRNKKMKFDVSLWQIVLIKSKNGSTGFFANAK
jgi:hypothetical protein